MAIGPLTSCVIGGTTLTVYSLDASSVVVQNNVTCVNTGSAVHAQTGGIVDLKSFTATFVYSYTQMAALVAKMIPDNPVLCSLGYSDGTTVDVYGVLIRLGIEPFNAEGTDCVRGIVEVHLSDDIEITCPEEE